MIYIQRKDAHGLETVDQFETREEAHAMVIEYSISDIDADYYLSQRPCKDWSE